MTKVPQRTSVQGPIFIRLLASLSEADIAHAPLSLSERLSQWIDWTRAVAVSRALDGRLPAVDGEGPAFDHSQDMECAKARHAIDTRIGEWRPPASSDDAALITVDYSPFHRHCLEMQRAMQTTAGRWRGQLREMLARQSAEMARLAEMDAVMELILSPREHALLATVPVLLGQHFQRLQAAAEADLADPASATSAAAVGLERFRHDLQSVLRAELDVRFQPIDALLAALRTR